jgi:prepilin-type N-terminal cleavage/methylation domain-containing protein
MPALLPSSALQHPRGHGLRRGFTLMEIMVVIAIIVVLMGLLVGVAAHAKENARIRQTRLTLHTLDALMKDYVKEYPEPAIPTEAEYWKNAALGMPPPDPAYDETCVPDYTKQFPQSILAPKTPAPTSDPIYWVKVLTVFAPKPMASFTKGLDLVTGNPPPPKNTVILDAWGTPIRYVPYNIDGTKKDGYFQSAGPDRIFMNSVNIAPNATKPFPPDDLYSTDPF